MKTITECEVDWYIVNGKYLHRLARNSSGHLYVVGDYAWHLAHPALPEYIEQRMSESIRMSAPEKT